MTNSKPVGQDGSFLKGQLEQIEILLQQALKTEKALSGCLNQTKEAYLEQKNEAIVAITKMVELQTELSQAKKRHASDIQKFNQYTKNAQGEFSQLKQKVEDLKNQLENVLSEKSHLKFEHRSAAHLNGEQIKLLKKDHQEKLNSVNDRFQKTLVQLQAAQLDHQKLTKANESQRAYIEDFNRRLQQKDRLIENYISELALLKRKQDTQFKELTLEYRNELHTLKNKYDEALAQLRALHKKEITQYARELESRHTINPETDNPSF